MSRVAGLCPFLSRIGVRLASRRVVFAGLLVLGVVVAARKALAPGAGDGKNGLDLPAGSMPSVSEAHLRVGALADEARQLAAADTDFGSVVIENDTLVRAASRGDGS